MFLDWIHWCSSLDRDALWYALLPLLVLDVGRYLAGSVVLWCGDFCRALFTRAEPKPFNYAPNICVIVAGLNEADTVVHTLRSVWGTYPHMEIIVVDDGSTDGMSEVAQAFADEHSGVRVLRKPRRGGKSSALNFALPFTEAEILVCVDGDSHVRSTAIWEILQPLQDPSVAAVAGTVVARNPFYNLCTWCQALEYLRCIFLGRMLTSKLDMLGVVSGAFGAYRREAVMRAGGWDVGPGEDGDLALRLRKAGLRVVFAPYAQCLTNLPIGWWRLIKQRRRWEWAVVTFECRKHVDLANLFSPNFRLSNLLLLLERWIYSVILPYVFWGYLLYLYLAHGAAFLNLMFFTYLVYLVCDYIQLALILYYSLDRKRDFVVGLITPLMPLYLLLMRGVSAWAVLEEFLTRRSYRDSFVPEHVRDVTWHW